MGSFAHLPLPLQAKQVNDMVFTLLRLGADPNLKDAAGVTVYMVAAGSRNYELLSHLLAEHPPAPFLSFGSSNPTQLLQANKDGQGLLHFVATSSHWRGESAVTTASRWRTALPRSTANIVSLSAVPMSKAALLMEHGPDLLRRNSGFLMEGFSNDCLGCGPRTNATALSRRS